MQGNMSETVSHMYAANVCNEMRRMKEKKNYTHLYHNGICLWKPCLCAANGRDRNCHVLCLFESVYDVQPITVTEGVA